MYQQTEKLPKLYGDLQRRMQIKGCDQSSAARKQRLERYSSVKHKMMKQWPIAGCTIIQRERIDVPRATSKLAATCGSDRADNECMISGQSNRTFWIVIEHYKYPATGRSSDDEVARLCSTDVRVQLWCTGSSSEHWWAVMFSYKETILETVVDGTKAMLMHV